MTDEPVLTLSPGDLDGLAARVAAHPFARGLDTAHVATLAAAAGEVVVPAGGFVFRRGADADGCFLLTAGDVALEVATPGREPTILQTLHPGDVLGWSWLWPPRRWHLDAHCRTAVEAIVLDATVLRQQLRDDPVLGHAVTMRIGALLVDRLEHARDQLASVVTT